MQYYELMDFFTQFKIMYGDPEEDDPEAEVPEEGSSEGVVELTSKNFGGSCRKRKGLCAIAMLSAISSIDYEKANHDNYVAMLKRRQSKRVSSQISYSWVNATC